MLKLLMALLFIFAGCSAENQEHGDLTNSQQNEVSGTAGKYVYSADTTAKSAAYSGYIGQFSADGKSFTHSDLALDMTALDDDVIVGDFDIGFVSGQNIVYFNTDDNTYEKTINGSSYSGSYTLLDEWVAVINPTYADNAGGNTLYVGAVVKAYFSADASELVFEGAVLKLTADTSADSAEYSDGNTTVTISALTADGGNYDDGSGDTAFRFVSSQLADISSLRGKVVYNPNSVGWFNADASEFFFPTFFEWYKRGDDDADGNAVYISGSDAIAFDTANNTYERNSVLYNYTLGDKADPAPLAGATVISDTDDVVGVFNAGASVFTLADGTVYSRDCFEDRLRYVNWTGSKKEITFDLDTMRYSGALSGDLIFLADSPRFDDKVLYGVTGQAVGWFNADASELFWLASFETLRKDNNSYTLVYQYGTDRVQFNVEGYLVNNVSNPYNYTLGYKADPAPLAGKVVLDGVTAVGTFDDSASAFILADGTVYSRDCFEDRLRYVNWTGGKKEITFDLNTMKYSGTLSGDFVLILEVDYNKSKYDNYNYSFAVSFEDPVYKAITINNFLQQMTDGEKTIVYYYWDKTNSNLSEVADAGSANYFISYELEANGHTDIVLSINGVTHDGDVFFAKYSASKNSLDAVSTNGFNVDKSISSWTDAPDFINIVAEYAGN